VSQAPEPIWLEKDALIAIHDLQIAEHGGSPGLRDEGLLESALARARMKWAYGEIEIPELAAAYAFGIARNHPFFDGNKRTAHIAMRLFLKLNGHDMSASQDEKYQTIMRLAAGDLTEEALAAWLKSRATLR